MKTHSCTLHTLIHILHTKIILSMCGFCRSKANDNISDMAHQQKYIFLPSAIHFSLSIRNNALYTNPASAESYLVLWGLCWTPLHHRHISQSSHCPPCWLPDRLPSLAHSWSLGTPGCGCGSHWHCGMERRPRARLDTSRYTWQMAITIQTNKQQT